MTDFAQLSVFSRSLSKKKKKKNLLPVKILQIRAIKFVKIKNLENLQFLVEPNFIKVVKSDEYFPEHFHTDFLVSISHLSVLHVCNWPLNNYLNNENIIFVMSYLRKTLSFTLHNKLKKM